MSNGNGDYPSTPQRSDLHVAIIMDGSGRWAEARGRARVDGHRAGRAAVGRVVEAALERGVRVLTLFTFSSDNWGRPATEVSELMRTFEEFFRVDAPALATQGARITAIGRRDRLPLSLLAEIEKIEAQGPAPASHARPAACERHPAFSGAMESAEGTSAPSGGLHVRFAIDYSGREAILDAARQFQRLSNDSPAAFARLLAGVHPGAEPTPDIDLLIRTGGELRLSNCPLWEIAYAELYFTPCMWPDFGAAELDAALQEFRMRQRRFGRVPAAAA